MDECCSPGEPPCSLASKQGPRYRHIADDTAPRDHGVEKLTPIIGAEISGVDLASPLSNRTMDEIHRALAENLVILRDQHISPQQHLAFAPIRRSAYSSRRPA
jgi:taurine dioxygenase